MGVKVTRVAYHAECELIEVEIDGQKRDSIFTCKAGGEGFLYARNDAVEYFKVPEKREEGKEEEGEPGE